MLAPKYRTTECHRCPVQNHETLVQRSYGQTIWDTLYLWEMYIILLLFYSTLMFSGVESRSLNRKVAHIYIYCVYSLLLTTSQKVENCIFLFSYLRFWAFLRVLKQCSTPNTF